MEITQQVHSMIIKFPKPKKSSLEDLFSKWDGKYELDDELREWEQIKPIGRELL